MHKVIEALEARIAPAAVFTYTEADGDVVTIKTSAKISNADFAAYLAEHGEIDGDGYSFALLGPVFRKTDLTITVVPGAVEGIPGNGKASIGHIEANVDLRNVTIAGDLRSIEVGDANFGTAALNKLQVENLGGDDDSSSFYGDVNAIKVTGNLTGSLFAGGEVGAGIFKKITVGESVLGSGCSAPDIVAWRIGSFIVAGDMEAAVEVKNIGVVRIGGNLQGIDGRGDSGTFYADHIKSVRIDGSILGADAENSAGIWANSIGSVLVGRDLIGGSGEDSGFIGAYNYLGKVVVKGNVQGGSGEESGQIVGGDIGSLHVGGSLTGGLGSGSGLITVYEGGSINRLVVAGSIVGGAGDDSGGVDVMRVGTIRIGGNLQGGEGAGSGSIFAFSINSTYIGDSIIGGTGGDSGTLSAFGLGNVRVVNDVIGTAEGSGSILGFAGIDSVKIGRNVSGAADQSGSIASLIGDIDSITIGGNLTNTGAGISGIFAGGSIDRVVISGNATGGNSDTLGIRAGGGEFGVGGGGVAIGSVSIKGDVTGFVIEAGLDLDGEVVAPASIGSVNIGGNFTASRIVAGVDAGVDGLYGTADDIAPFGADVVSRIASVVIGGSVAGTPTETNATDAYGIVAQHIAAVKIAGVKQGLVSGPSNDLEAKLLGTTGDVRLVEVPLALPG